MAGLEELIADEQRRLDELLGVNYALALNGDRVSTDFCLAIMRRRCDLAALAPRGGPNTGVDPKAALLARLEANAANLASGGPAWREDVASVAAVARAREGGGGESPHPTLAPQGPPSPTCGRRDALTI